MAIKDNFPGGSASSQARNFEAIMPNDATDVGQRYKAIWVGSAGNLAVIGDEGGAAKVMKGIAAGTLLLISPVRIPATGTTAADLIGWF